MITKVTNLTRLQIIATQTRLARSYFARMFGLMGRKTLAQGEALIIDPCSSVHTHWMRFAIDVIYVNKSNIIVGIDANLKPWRIGKFYKHVQYVVELPAGTADNTGTLVGDRLVLE
jgi:uncharacterized protein